ncbi:MAG: nicotinate-nucleotide adenylyltransferase [Rhodocyclaceae bacterium]
MSDRVTGPLGILGGTFDPIHFGHLRLAEEARDALGLTTVRVIPAGQPPHREQPGTVAEDRLNMARLAIAGVPGYELDDSEVVRQSPSYTVLTLRRLRAELGTARPLVLILGADAFLGLPSWHEWEEILPLAHIAVGTRPGFELDAATMGPVLADLFSAAHGLPTDPAAPAGRIVPFHMTALDISATGIRAALTAGRSARFLLPDAVLDYIETHHLY